MLPISPPEDMLPILPPEQDQEMRFRYALSQVIQFLRIEKSCNFIKIMTYINNLPLTKILVPPPFEEEVKGSLK